MNRGEALAFCELLYGHEIIQSEGLQIEVMSISPGKDGKVGYTFCKTPKAAAETALRIAKDNDNAYACMSLVDPKKIKKKRGTAKDSKGIVGFWADIDIADPAAPKPGKNPPVSWDEAVAIAMGVGATPSVVVRSGHGMHAYWLFKRPWLFADESERDFAADVAKGWSNTLKMVARDHGRTLDSVFDLARVLRIPGTINTKNPAIPTQVDLVVPPKGHYHRIKRHDRMELQSLIRAPEEGQADEVVKPQKLKDVEFRFPNELERAKLESKVMIACMNDRTFKDTWEKKRIDFQSGDQSASEYDMSIANQLIASGWDEQEVLWALVLWREKHGSDTDKILKRADYVELTIAKAKKGNVVAVAAKEITNLTAEVQQLQRKYNEAPSPEIQQQIDTELEEKRQKAFETVSKLIGAHLTGFMRDGLGKDANYYLEFDGKKCLIGSVDDLFTIKRVRSCIYTDADIVLGKIGETDWWQAMQLLTSFRAQRTNPYLTPSYRWLSYLLGYIERAPHIGDKEENPECESQEVKYQRMLRRQPYWENGKGQKRVFFHLESLRSHVQKYFGDRTPHDEIVDAIRAIGGVPEHVHKKLRGKKLHRYLWTISEIQLEAHSNIIQDGLRHDYTDNVKSPTNNDEE
jgi:hypothetical protein